MYGGIFYLYIYLSILKWYGLLMVDVVFSWEVPRFQSFQRLIAFITHVFIGFF